MPHRSDENGNFVKISLKGTPKFSIRRACCLLEEELIRRALRETKGNCTTAAELLQISRRALVYKMRYYGIYLN